MNPNANHTDYHPGETDEWLEEQVARIRAEIAATQTPPPRPVAYWEWYMDNRPMTDEEYDGAIRRMNRRGHVVTDVPIGRGAPTTLNVIRGGKA